MITGVKDYLSAKINQMHIQILQINEKKERKMEFDINDHTKHPVSNVIWVESGKVHANDYNPNTVARPEMELLKD